MKKSEILNSEELVAKNIKRMESIVKILEEGIGLPQELHDNIRKIKNEILEIKTNIDQKNNGNSKSNQH